MSAEKVFSVENSLLSENPGFQEPPICYGNDLISCTETVTIPYGPFIFIP